MKDQILNLPSEIWKPIKGFEKLYKISNLGRIKGTRKTYERLLKFTLTYNGYNRAHLCKNNKGKPYRVGKLVGQHFKSTNGLEKESKYPLQINHINGIKTDDRASNLEWVTPSQNILHAYKENLIDRNTRLPKWKRFIYDPITKQLQMFNTYSLPKDLAAG